MKIVFFYDFQEKSYEDPAQQWRILLFWTICQQQRNEYFLEYVK